MIRKAAAQDDGFLLDVTALQEKHVATSRALLDDTTAEGKAELTAFTAELLRDIDNLKSMLHAISIGARRSLRRARSVLMNSRCVCARVSAYGELGALDAAHAATSLGPDRHEVCAIYYMSKCGITIPHFAHVPCVYAPPPTHFCRHIVDIHTSHDCTDCQGACSGPCDRCFLGFCRWPR